MGAEWGIVCSVRAPHRYMRFGAKCVVVNTNPGWAGEHLEVVGMTRGGRTTRTWIDARDLSNYRAAWIPPNKEGRIYSTKEDAAGRAAFFQERYGDTPMRDLRPPQREGGG